MTLEEYEKEVMRTAGTLERELTKQEKDSLMGSMGLSGEAGEVLEIFKKYIFHGHKFDRDKYVKEMGDVYWYFTFLNKVTGVTLDEIMETNISKLRARYEKGFSQEASINRKDDK